MKLGVRKCLIAALATLGMIVGVSAARAGEPVAIYTFQGGLDGSTPLGNLVADPAGNLYGATLGGGTSNHGFGFGTVFELSPPATQSGAWTETVLYSFTGGADGSEPRAGLTRDAAGDIYGTTLLGGCLPNCSGFGYGTVFKLTPPASGSGPWVFATIYRFQPRFGVQDGSGPEARLTLDGVGDLFGTTVSGGLNVECCGVVFELSPPPSGSGPWTETLLHVFSGFAEGAYPRGGVTFDSARNLYGTTTQGGRFGRCCGTVFELSPSKSGPWTDSIILRFTLRNGSVPLGDLVFDAAGNLYGAASQGEGNGAICGVGCGAAFELSPPPGGTGDWTEQTIYRFPGAFPPSPATTPVWVLYQNGKLYGVTQGGVASQPQGGLFVLTPSGRKFWNIVTASFTGNAGANPRSLVADPAVSGATTFYGVAATGGATGNGTVFSWTP